MGASEVERLVDGLFEDAGRHGQTYAVVIVHGGSVVVERYGGAIPHRGGADEAVGPATPLLSWSMAKSVLHAVCGLLVRDGLLTIDEPAPVPAWQAPGDPRAAITVDDLLAMRDGLAFVEDYSVTPGRTRADVDEMLFHSGRDDVAAFAAAHPLAHPPGTRFNYSSGTSNILARIVGDRIATVAGPGRDGVRAYVERELFAPVGMTSARLRFDAAGTWIASSFVHATAPDWARFGLLYLRGGDGLLPAGWVEHGTRQRSVDEDGDGYGAHWWVVDDARGIFRASGYRGQWILVAPDRDLVVVRLGHSDESCNAANAAWRAAILDAFA